MYRKILLIGFVLVNLQCLAQKKKTLFIIIDGVSADVMERTTPQNMKAIATQGAYLRIHQGGDKGTYNETPTVSSPGYNNVLTGVWLNKHNVNNNQIKEPNYHYPTIFRLLKNQYPEKKIAVYSTWLDNRTKLVGDGLPQTGNLKVDIHYDGYEKDTIRFKPDQFGDRFYQIDKLVATEAAASVKHDAPDLSWVYLQETDNKGHRYGDGPEYYDALKRIDEEVGMIYDAIKYRQKQFKEDWLLIITTDHGRAEEDGKRHGLQQERMRNTWLVTNKKELNTYANIYDPASVDILPTIAQFMAIKPGKDIQYELDGTPLMGPVSIAQLHAYGAPAKTIVVTWKALKKTGDVKIWVTPTNNFKSGGKDEYVLLGEFPVKQKFATVDVSKYPSTFYKVVAEAPDNTLNTWVNLAEADPVSTH